MRALVTGATGLLGRCLTNLLLENGVAVRAFVRPTSDVRHLTDQGVELSVGNADDRDSIVRAVRDVDLLFHLAGYLTAGAPFGAGADDPRYQTVNVDFTRRLLEAAHRAGVGRFLFASSSSVYDRGAPVPTPETAPLRPRSAYGRSKRAAEGQVRAFQAQGLATTIVRPAVIYGPGDRYFTPTALQLARLPLLPLVDGGRRLFDLIYVRDVAELMWQAARSPAAAGRVYNAGPGTAVTLRDLVHAYRQLTGRGPRILSIAPVWARRSGPLLRPLLARLVPGAGAALTPAGVDLMSRDLHLDMTRAASDLNFQPRFSLKQGLAETLNHISGLRDDGQE